MNKNILLLSFCFHSFLFTSIGFAQEFIPLWPQGKMPNTKGLGLTDSIANERVFRVGVPGMYAFFPSNQENKGAAVVICPGGGYERLAYNISGFQLAKWFNTLGINAFVLNYRLPNSVDLVQRETGAIMDAQRAIKYIRAHANELHIKSNKIGMQGSSAGGHLAAMIANINVDLSKIGDDLDTISPTPNFCILVSPVIDMGNYAHKGSKKNLLGEHPSNEQIQQYSVQNIVHKNSPPHFIVGAINDASVAPMNNLLYYKSLLEQKISVSYHIFPQGAHSIAVRNNPGSADLWTSLCEAWMNEMKITEAVLK